jgi:hypothetical protein
MTSQRHYFFYRKLLNYASRNRAGNRPSAIKIRNDQNFYRNRCRRRRMRANLSSLNRARERFGGVAAAGSGAAQFPLGKASRSSTSGAKWTAMPNLSAPEEARALEEM